MTIPDSISPLPDNEIARLNDGPLRLLEPFQQAIFAQRLRAGWDDIVRPLDFLYGRRPDFENCIRKFVAIAARAFAERSSPLHARDQRRLYAPDWFQQSDMMGYVAYTDRLAADLAGIADHIPYLKELGVTYLHLMPLLAPRPGPNDGGYAVADYRAVNPELGTMTDLARLAARLHEEEISLCVDLVCNHTAKEHPWAQAAREGHPVYRDYFHTFPDRTLPDAFELTLPEVFPEFKPGNFTYYPDMERWVWTTFNEFQWDLNYANPAVFGEMLANILFLANQGIDILRLDAVAFMWKRLGADSQNEPEVHAILQAFRALSRLAAPGLLLKAEAIVPRDQLVRYLGSGEATNKECELAYNNQLMVLLWSALAEGEVRLLTYALEQMPPIPERSAWCTYVRCHDDIGWAVRDEDAGALGLSGVGHRAFLSDFYSGRYPETFARGATFQFNERTGDRRISGSLASLAGLEAGLLRGDSAAIELALQRIHLLHAVIFAFGGIPLIYMGDELGLLNDYDYVNSIDHADDNRWLHRPAMDWALAARREDTQTISGRVFQSLRHLAAARRATPALHAQATSLPVWTHNDRIFGLLRTSARGRLLLLANFAAETEAVSDGRLRDLGIAGPWRDRLTDQIIPAHTAVSLPAYGVMWLESL